MVTSAHPTLGPQRFFTRAFGESLPLSLRTIGMTPKERAAQVGAMPHVKAWVKRFQKLAAEMPPEVWVFVASGTPVVLALDEDGHEYETGPSYSRGNDQAASIKGNIVGGRWDGGDF
jgi:hypothetical protein